MRRLAPIVLFAVVTACAGQEGSSGAAGTQGPQGAAGVQGLPGTTGPQGPAGPAGSRGANWAGGWSALTRYQADDAVDHLGSSYVAVVAPVLGLAPPNTDWQLVASKGATGDQGPQGLKGDKGDQGLPGIGSVVLLETGAGLAGGPISTTGTISIAPGGVSNAMLASSGISVTAGAGLMGGGAVSLGGTVSLSSAPLAGDVSGSPLTTTVTALQGTAVAATTPADGQVLAYSSASSSWAPRTLPVIPQVATYRYAVFDTYDQGSGWMAGNDPSLFGGIAPSAWTDGSAVASSMSSSKEVLRTLFNKKGYAGANALVVSESTHQASSTNGRVAVVLFRIRNTTAADIVWTPAFRATSYSAWGELASVAFNGAAAWSSASVGGSLVPASGPYSVALTVPAGRVSSAIFVSTTGPAYGMGSFLVRSLFLAFVNNSLALPAGLQFVDDLDTATGDWTQ
jgi:hypothetical protein